MKKWLCLYPIHTGNPVKLMDNKKTILVTGSCGFIGKKLVSQLLSLGYKVIAACMNPDNLADLRCDNLQILEFDITGDFDKLQVIRENIDIMCHLAAFIPNDFEDISLAEKCYKINSLGTLKMMEYGITKNARHFIYFTSGNVYEYSDTPVKEIDKIYPSQKATYYLASKLMGELYVDHFRQAGILKTTILRISSVYGQGMKETEYITRTIDNISNSKEVTINNEDMYKTDFVFVNDIIQVACKAIENGLTGIYNIGSGNQCSLGQAAKIICKLLNKPESLIRINPINDYSKISKGFSALDMTKTMDAIKFVPTAIEDGIYKMIFKGE